MPAPIPVIIFEEGLLEVIIVTILPILGVIAGVLTLIPLVLAGILFWYVLEFIYKVVFPVIVNLSAYVFFVFLSSIIFTLEIFAGLIYRLVYYVINRKARRSCSDFLWYHWHDYREAVADISSFFKK